MLHSKLFTMYQQLTKNFKVSEFEYSETAQQHGIDNTVKTQSQYIDLLLLCSNVLQPLRNYLGYFLDISSGYRCEELNELIKGSKTSQHKECKAADIVCDNLDKAFYYIKYNCDFDQLIWEFGDDKKPNWIHVSFNQENNRKQVLKSIKQYGVTKYLNF